MFIDNSNANNNDNNNDQEQPSGEESKNTQTVNFDDPKVQQAINKLVESRVRQETEGLVKNRDKLLEEAKLAKTQLREIKDRYGDDLSKFDELLDKERKQREAEMTFEEKLTSQYEREKKQLTEMWKSKEEEYKNTLTKKDKALRQYLIDSQLEAELTAAGGISHFLKPTLAGQLSVVEADGGYQVRVMDNDVPRLKMDGTPMTISDLVSVYKNDESWGAAFKASGATGGGATGNEKNTNKSSMSKPKSQWSDAEAASFISKYGPKAYHEHE